MNIVESFWKLNYLQAVLAILLAIVASFISHKLIDLFFHYQRTTRRYRRSEDLKKRSRTIGRIFKTGIDIFIWIYAALMFLQYLGVNIPSLLTGAGLIGAMIGFGAQNTIRDILAGFFIVLENQYRVGDSIETQIAGRHLSGKVENITLRITQIRDTDGKLHTIRNGASEAVTNMSFKYANVNLVFGVSYQTDIDELEQIINKVGEEMLEREDLVNEIIEPIRFLRVNKFLDSSIEIKCLGRVNAGKQWYVAGEFRRALKKAFDEKNISIPYPQLVIHQAKK